MNKACNSINNKGVDQCLCGTDQPVLSLANVSVSYRDQCILDNVSLDLFHGQVIGLMGPSGEGKSTLLHCLAAQLERGFTVNAGSLYLEGKRESNILSFPLAERIELMSRIVAFMHQQPSASLDELMTVQEHAFETYRAVHPQEPSRTARQYAQGYMQIYLKELGFQDPQKVLHSYPFMLSGGMQQRVCLALALLANVRVLLADEPSSALDYKTQRMLADLLVHMAKKHHLAVVFASHDESLVRSCCDEIYRIQAGRISHEQNN